MNDANKTIAITGANGFLGQELVRYFSDAGWSVRALVRDPSKATAQKNVGYAAYDITKPVADDLLQGVDYLVHAAYVKYDRQHPDAMDLNIKGAKALAANAKRHSVHKVIFMSSMSAHDEAVSVYGRQKLAIEQVFDPATSAIIRSGLILGNGGIVEEMSAFMRSKHAVPLIGGGKQPLQVVAVYDLAQAISRIIERDITGTLVVATPKVYTYKQFYAALATSLGIKILYVPVPFNLLLGIFRTAAALHVPLGVGEDNLMGLKMLRSMDSEADIQKLGMTLDPLETALTKLHTTGTGV